MRVGVVILPEQPWLEAAGIWRDAEQLGFAHLWTYDHLAWSTLRDSPWFGAVPVLAAAATVTSTAKLGTLVASPNFRHPVPLAREVIALDEISAGRFVLGIGAGGEGWDAEVLGHEPWSRAERSARFAEFVELTDRLLREREVDYDGRYYRAAGARTHPGCRQQPRAPLYVAATGPRAMAVVARFGDAWVTTGPRGPARAISASEGAKMVAEQRALLDAACASAARDPMTIPSLVLGGPVLDEGLSSPQAFADTLGAYAESGVTDFVVHWPRPSDPYRGDRATFERVVSAHLG